MNVNEVAASGNHGQAAPSLLGQPSPQWSARGGQLEAKVERAVYECLGRPPSNYERTELAAYAREHGLANLCRVLINLNEFVFIE